MKTQLKNCSQFLLQCVMIYGTNLTPFSIVRLFRILKQFRNQNSTNSTCVPARYVAFFSFFSFFFVLRLLGSFFFKPSFKIKPTYLVLWPLLFLGDVSRTKINHIFSCEYSIFFEYWIFELRKRKQLNKQMKNIFQQWKGLFFLINDTSLSRVLWIILLFITPTQLNTDMCKGGKFLKKLVLRRWENITG